MRKKFFKLVHQLMKDDKDIYLLVGNLGFGGIDPIRKDYPNQFIDCGASEQAMMGMAVGLALSGKKVFVYSITPFLLWRAAETIRNYIAHEKIPVCLIGSGRNDDYLDEGFSHNAQDDFYLIHSLEEIKSEWPEHEFEVEGLVKDYVDKPQAMYVNLRR
jgi:transketolase